MGNRGFAKQIVRILSLRYRYENTVSDRASNISKARDALSSRRNILVKPWLVTQVDKLES